MKLTCLLSSITCIFVLVFPIVLSSGVFEKHQSEATPLWQLGANIHHQQDGSAITSRLYSKRDGGTSTHVDLVQDLSNGWWFANFTIGNSTLSCQIDTGSSDVIVNPGFYVPSEASVNLHRHFSSAYETTEPNGTGYATASGKLFRDTIVFNGLTAYNQTIGDITLADPNPLPNTHECLVGFADRGTSEWGTNSLFHTLCNQGKLHACRFGLALNTDGTGTQVIGELDQTLYHGELTKVPLTPNNFYGRRRDSEWWVFADIIIGGEVFYSNAYIAFDSGTVNIVGPIDQVRLLFEKAGIQSVEYPEPGGDILLGYYNCASPPQFGLNLPSASNASSATPGSPTSKTSKVFPIIPKSFQFEDNAKGNCTATIIGFDTGYPENVWIFGQSFFQGKYIDHNSHDKTMGFAHLKA